MYGAIFRCKMCGKEFPYIEPGEKEEIYEALGVTDWDYTPYGAGFPEDRIVELNGLEKVVPSQVPHYCNGDRDHERVGVAELIGFKEMVQYEGGLMTAALSDIDNYIGYFKDNEEYRVEYCILKYIKEIGFDTTGWHVDQVAVTNIYSFTDGKDGWFDLKVDEETGKVQPCATIMTEMKSPGYVNLVPVNSIEEAIQQSAEWMRACNEDWRVKNEDR